MLLYVGFQSVMALFVMLVGVFHQRSFVMKNLIVKTGQMRKKVDVI